MLYHTGVIIVIQMNFSCHTSLILRKKNGMGGMCKTCGH